MIAIGDVRAAAERLRGVAVRTPVLPLKYSDAGRLLVKCENLQHGGSFKFRGAYNMISCVLDEARRNGIVTYSSGNHAQGAALAASRLGVHAMIVMLDQSLPVKVQRTRRFGGEVIFGGTTSEAIQRRAEEIARERGAVLVPPFNDPRIMAGQGTAGLEILEDVPDVAAVVVPIGGGGLISGIATAVKQMRPAVRVYGVEPQGAPKVRRSLDAGELVTLPGTNTVADGLKPVRAGDLTFEVIRARVDDVVLVGDEEILETCRYLILEEKIVAEPSGAAALAAVRHGKIPVPPGPVVCVVSGGNFDPKVVFG